MSSASDLARQFQGQIQRLNATRSRIERACEKKLLRPTDVETAYAGLFLQLVVRYEATVERFVLGLLVRPGGVSSSRTGVKGSISVKSYKHALALTAGPNRPFASWLKKQDLVGISELLLHRGAPFKAAGASALDWHFVERAHYIRNAIAHPSTHALKQFRKHLVDNAVVANTERFPAPFLRGKIASGGQTRWEVYAAGLNQFVNSTIL